MKNKLKVLVSYYAPYKKTFLLNLICSVISSLTVISIPIVVRYVMDNVFDFEKNKAIIFMILFSIAVFILFIINYLCNRYMTHHGKNMGSEIEKDMCNRLFDYYQKQSFSFFDENKLGKLSSVMTIDIRNISSFLYEAPITILDFLIRIVAALVIFFSINKWFGLVSTTVLCLVLLYTSYYVPKIQKNINISRDKISDLNAKIHEVLSGMKVVQSFTNEELESKKFYELNNAYLDEQKSINKVDSILKSGLNSFVIGLIPIITIISLFFVINNLISINDLITYMLYIDILISPIFSITAVIKNFQESLAGYKRFFNILNTKIEINDSTNALDLKEVAGNIEFSNVYFKYKRATNNVLENFDLKINAGDYVALVGPSGSGKTTICDLIPRFYEVSGGDIFLDGVNIKNIKLESLRKNIGIVYQETFLFSGTIFDNIKYGNPNASHEQVIEAAKQSYVHDFIMKLPEGYQTQVGQRGDNLSGGQKQRIAIARVFLKNPPILIFDEATSNLDSENEKYIQKAIENLSVGRTTIVIAHKLNTIKNAKKILVIDKGKIIDQGTHSELIETSMNYKMLFKGQEKQFITETI